MDALILSCGTGGGHNTAGLAVEQALLAGGHAVTFLDPFTLKGEGTSSAVNHAYITVAQRAPRVFGAAYALGNAYRRLPVKSPVYHANRVMAPYLEKYLAENPCDAIVTTHLFPAEILTGMRSRGIRVPTTVFVATDYTCIPFTEETNCDYYVIPSPELTEEFVSRGIPRDRIRPLGIPVRAEFQGDGDRAACRARLGLAPEEKIILVAGGSIGAGHLDAAVATLLEEFPDTRVIAVCGNNKSLLERLRRKYTDRCLLMDSTPHMADYMRACDILVSKPGGLSSTEAANLGAALIHLTPIPGCETRNMNFFAARGMCLPVTDPQRELAEACRKLSDPALRDSMRANQRKYIPQDAASQIRTLLETVKASK